MNNITLHGDSQEADFFQLIERHQAGLFQHTVNYDHPLNLAVRWNSLPAIEALIALNADPNVADREGNTPLHFALGSRNSVLEKLLKIVPMLLKAGANPNVHNRKRGSWTWIKDGDECQHDTPLHLLAHRMQGGSSPLYLELLGSLLEAGGDLSQLNAKFVTPASGIFKYLHRNPKLWEKISPTLAERIKNVPIPDQANEEVEATVEKINKALSIYYTNSSIASHAFLSSYDDGTDSSASGKMSRAVQIVREEILRLAEQAKALPFKPIEYFRDQKRITRFVNHEMSSSQEYKKALFG